MQPTAQAVGALRNINGLAPEGRKNTHRPAWGGHFARQKATIVSPWWPVFFSSPASRSSSR